MQCGIWSPTGSSAAWNILSHKSSRPPSTWPFVSAMPFSATSQMKQQCKFASAISYLTSSSAKCCLRNSLCFCWAQSSSTCRLPSTPSRKKLWGFSHSGLAKQSSEVNASSDSKKQKQKLENSKCHRPSSSIASCRCVRTAPLRSPLTCPLRFKKEPLDSSWRQRLSSSLTWKPTLNKYLLKSYWNGPLIKRSFT